jgi:tetratricopeptide (TPR) repeat protein
MKQVLSRDAISVGRFAVVATAAWLIGISSSYAQLPGRENPFPGATPAPTTPAVPADPATTPPATPAPEPMPAVPGEQPAPAPAPEGAPSAESQPYVPQATPAEEQIKLGVELMEQGKNDLAIQHFEEATKLAAEPVEKANSFFQLGRAFRSLNRFDEAIDAYSAALENDPDDGEAYLNRGIAWFHKGEFGIAWNDFDDASAVFLGTEPYAELWKGLAKAQQGDWLEAVNSYAHAILQEPRFPLAYANRGLAYLQLNEPHKAVADFNQAIRHDQRNPAHYFRRGVAQARLGRIPEAIESYNQALRLDPNYADALKNRSILMGNAAR